MTHEERKLAIDKILPEVIRQARAAQEANALVPISGKRCTLPLEGRTIDIAYYPAEKENAPLLIGCHGGGFLFGGSAMDDELWTRIAASLEMNVASVNYRMSPDARDYDCLYDVYDSALYLLAHADDFGFNPAHVSVFGSSAGGNLAAACCLLAKQRGDLFLEYQILMYPFLDGATDPDSKGPGSFSGLLPYIMNQLHFSPEKATDPLLSPVFAGKELLEGLPKAIISYCEDDNLRFEAISYAKKLREAGTPAATFLAPIMPHGYIEYGFRDRIDEMAGQILGESGVKLFQDGVMRQVSEETLRFIQEEMHR